MEWEIPNDNLTLGDIEPGADLMYADLSDASLGGADLSGADLHRADLSGADLQEVDLSGADLRWANLSGAELDGADLSESNLVGANLLGADIVEAQLSGVALSRGTQMEFGLDTIKEKAAEYASSEEPETEAWTWDVVARVNHELKTAYSANGLVGKARDYHFQERAARGSRSESGCGELECCACWVVNVTVSDRLRCPSLACRGGHGRFIRHSDDSICVRSRDYGPFLV